MMLLLSLLLIFFVFLFICSLFSCFIGTSENDEQYRMFFFFFAFHTKKKLFYFKATLLKRAKTANYDYQYTRNKYIFFFFHCLKDVGTSKNNHQGCNLRIQVANMNVLHESNHSIVEYLN